MSDAAGARPDRNWWQVAAHLARRAWRMELGSYQAIFRFVCRRPRVPQGATGFTYHQPVLALLLAFIAVSVVELVVVDLLVRRWEAVRLPLLVVGVWGVVWMLGLLFAMLTRPHAVGPSGVRARYATEIDIGLGWDAVRSVDHRRRVVQGKQPKVTVDDQGRAALHLRMQDETNIDIALARPVSVRLPHGPETVERVSLYADDPRAFLDAVARHRTAPETRDPRPAAAPGADPTPSAPRERAR